MIEIPVSYGELYDKITILRIKVEKIRSEEAVLKAKEELALLEAKTKLSHNYYVRDEINQLYHVNSTLWSLEDSCRDLVRNLYFEDVFHCVKSVHSFNKQRHEIKRRIDDILGSKITEQKDYK